MNNRNVPVCFMSPMRMLVGGVRVEGWQKKKRREKKGKGSYPPG
jgi:hypothetical protein